MTNLIVGRHIEFHDEGSKRQKYYYFANGIYGKESRAFFSVFSLNYEEVFRTWQIVYNAIVTVVGGT